MNLVYKVRTWGNLHHPKMLDIIRMLLGILLVVKGTNFFNNSGYLRYLISEDHTINQSPEIITAVLIIVPYVHMVGGILIFLGLFTRLAALLQLPIVFGAVFFVNILSSFVNAELWLSIMVLALLMLFVIIGSGPLSIDHFLKRIKTSGDKKE